MNKLILTLPFLLLSFNFFGQINKVWSSDTTLSVPESVIYSNVHNCIFVSNVDGKPSVKDGNGFISKLSADGEIIELKWISGLDAPKGMAIADDLMYVSNITELVIIDIKAQKIIKRIPHDKARFLNDVTITCFDDVLVTDSANGLIYILKDDELQIWLQGDKLAGANGLLAEKDYVLVGVNSKILKVNAETKDVELFLETSSQVDGIQADGKGAYYFTHWQGRLYYYYPSKTATLLFDSSVDNIQSADIGYNSVTGEILVPTFFSNQVVSYKMD